MSTKLDFSPLSPMYWLGTDSGFANIAGFFDGIKVPQQWIDNKIAQTSDYIEDKKIESQKWIGDKFLDFQENSREYIGKLRNKGGMLVGETSDRVKTFVMNNKLFTLASFGLLFGPTMAAIAWPM